MSLLTATRLAPGGLRASSSMMRRLVPSLTSTLPAVPHPPPLTMRGLQSSTSLGNEVRPRPSTPTHNTASAAAIAAGRAHSTLMANLTIPPTDEHAAGLKHGARPTDAKAAHTRSKESPSETAANAIPNSTALRPEVRDSEEGQLVVGGGLGAEGAYNVSEYNRGGQ